jgi:dTMP kinase
MERKDCKVQKGYLICLEGLDKSGKTTHANLLVDELKRRGWEASYTTEPSKGPIGRLIKDYLLECKSRKHPAVEALLFAADRIDHVRKEINHMLVDNKIVVSDRYVYSTLAYQGAAGLDIEWIWSINKYAAKPDLAIYIDVSPEILLKRKGWGSSVMEQIEIQKIVWKFYMKLVDRGEMVCVNGNRSKEEVFSEILDLVLRLLNH